MPDGPSLAAALLAVREHVRVFQAAGVVLEAVEAAGDVAALVRELEEERELLQIEVATLRQEARASGSRWTRRKERDP